MEEEMDEKATFLDRVEKIFDALRGAMTPAELESEEAKNNEATIRSYIARQDADWFKEANELDDDKVIHRIFGAAFGDCIDLCGGR